MPVDVPLVSAYCGDQFPGGGFMMHLKVILIAIISILLASCATPAAPTAVTSTPAATLQPSPLLGTKWKLDRMIVSGETRTEPGFNHNLEFTRNNALWTDDGCNTIMVAVTITATTQSIGFAEEYDKTVLACERTIIDKATGEQIPVPATDPEYVAAVFSTVAYDLRDNELWLFYPDSKADALIYKRAEEVSSAVVVTKEVKPAATP
jgi:hypothetical protein